MTMTTASGGVLPALAARASGFASRRVSRLAAPVPLRSRAARRVTLVSASVAPQQHEVREKRPFEEELRATAKYISGRGKGILASDESNATTGKRLGSIGVENTEDNRRNWRELLYTAPGLGQYISGCIMFDETLFQKTRAGIPFVDVLRKQGIIPGIKVDTGLEPIALTDGETATMGLDGLSDRCKRYYAQGARFAKWRAVITINGSTLPTTRAILENCHGLARYAAIAQENGLVPIVEPEVTLGPGDYSIARTAYVSELVYSHTMRLLNEYDVLLEGILLKPNMVLPGLDATIASPEDIAAWTARTIRRTIPPCVPGIHFLSGGMSAEESTLNLQALQKYHAEGGYNLNFSYGRALQSPTLKTWAGAAPDSAGWKAAQTMLTALAKANSEAQRGAYKGSHPAPGKERILQALRLGGPGK